MSQTTSGFPWLRLCAVENTGVNGGQWRQAVQVLDADDIVIGEIAGVDRIAWEVLPGSLGKLTVQVIVDHADVHTVKQ